MLDAIAGVEAMVDRYDVSAVDAVPLLFVLAVELLDDDALDDELVSGEFGDGGL